MNIYRHVYLLAAILAGTLHPSLQAAEKPPARRNQPAPIVSPTIQTDGSVLFRMKAPRASEVSLSGQMTTGKVEMTRGEAGVWSVVLDDVAPGIYEYSFTVDGVKMIDPGNMQVKPQRSPQTSILAIPGNQLYDFLDVPHGTVHSHAYHSQPIGRFREMRVYTPPGYETGNRQYPLLVLQHGHSDCFATWTTHGKAHWILDNLIAAGKAEPMIVLMLDGHPVPESYGSARSVENTEELRRDLLGVALPMVEKLYRVKPGRENRAIAGLSMGGLHSLTIGLSELDTFAWIGAFSAAVPSLDAVTAALINPVQTNGRLKLLWIAIGKDDFLLKENETFTGLLDESGIRYEWKITEGNHSWPVWRSYIAEFAPRLFR
jgi:enterochelin esterase family protein